MDELEHRIKQAQHEFMLAETAVDKRHSWRKMAELIARREKKRSEAPEVR